MTIADETKVMEEEASSKNLSPFKSPFKVFQQDDLNRIAESDAYPVYVNSNDSDSDRVLFPIYTWQELQRLSSSSTTASLSVSKDTSVTASTAADDEERARFAKAVQESGGYIMLKLDEKEQKIVDSMWETMELMLRQSNQDDSDNDDIAPLLQHQTLTHANTKQAHEQSGYKFVQTFLQGDELFPKALKGSSIVDETQFQNLEKAFHLFSSIAEESAIVALSGAFQKDPKLMRRFVSGLIHDSQQFSGAYHRLSRYVSTNDKAGSKESLRSHTDWTLTTPIPMSQIPGLEVWRPHDKTWFRPEELVQRVGKAYHDDDGDNTNGSYVIVMMGKWVDLITNNSIQSCIHRVVVSQQDKEHPQARLSAPFFLRPKELLFQNIDQQFNQPSKTNTPSPEEAVRQISDFFQGFIDVIESSTQSAHKA